MKPTSKIIQITASTFLDDFLIIALCEDGSIWECDRDNTGRWHCIFRKENDRKSNGLIGQVTIGV